MYEIHLHFWRSNEIVLARVFDDADYFAPWTLRGGQSWFEAFPDCVFAWPIVARRLLTDHDRLNGVSLVLFVEIAALQDLDSHGAEVARPNGTIDHIQPLVRRWIGLAFNRDRHGIAVVGKRKIARHGGRFQTGQRGNAAHSSL